MGLTCYRPEINETDWLDARRLDLVEISNALGLGPKFTLNHRQSLGPMAFVRFELAEFVLVFREWQYALRFVAGVLRLGGADVFPLRFQDQPHGLRFLLSAGLQQLYRVLGVFLAACLQVREKFFHIARSTCLELLLNVFVYLSFRLMSQ